MPTIKRISAEPYNIPMQGTLKWGKGHELKQLEHVLIRVELSDGSIGLAEATPRPSIYGETQVSVLHIIEHHLAPLLIEGTVENFAGIANLYTRLELIKGNNTAKGALDMAVHHALACSQGKSLNTYLHNDIGRDKIQVSYIVSTGKADDVLGDVESAYGAGVRVFKVKIGKDIPQETDTIKQLMNQFPDAEYYVDANQTLSRENAAKILNTLYALGVIHCEEALPVHYIQFRHELRQQTSMPIIADDSAFTFNDLKREMSFDTFDILNIKTPRTGFSESGWMTNATHTEDKRIMIGSQASSLFGCLMAATYAASPAIDCANECTFFLKTDDDLSDAPPIVDGYMDLTDVQNSLEKLRQQLS